MKKQNPKVETQPAPEPEIIIPIQEMFEAASNPRECVVFLNLMKRACIKRQEFDKAAEFRTLLKEMEARAVRSCRRCGCTEANACLNNYGEPCSWVELDLCSHCLTPKEVSRYRAVHDVMDALIACALPAPKTKTLAALSLSTRIARARKAMRAWNQAQKENS